MHHQIYSFIAALTLGVISAHTAEMAPVSLLNHRTHLRSGTSAEWDEFTNSIPDGSRLELRFQAHTNGLENTILIRQDGVKEEWPVQLNGKKIGRLFQMEADLVHTIAVAPGAMREGENVLTVEPPKVNDDILIHSVTFDPRPHDEVIRGGLLSATIKDSEDKRLMPARLTITTREGTLAAVLSATNSLLLAVRPGVVYTGDGRATIALPTGDYIVYASRGFEWSVSTQRVHVAFGKTTAANFLLTREVATPGFVSCDTHVHTFTYSKHGDATTTERLITLAGEGIELPIATDHNVLADYANDAARLGMDYWFTPVLGDEVTTKTAHFNVFPINPEATVPDPNQTNWPALVSAMRSTPGARVVIMNHPRNIHNAFQPFASANFNNATGQNKRGEEYTFDAIEVLNSSAQQSDYMLVYRDWFALLNHGSRIMGVGSSDCHDVSRYIVGQGRTYVACDDTNPGRIEVGTACDNLLAGRALVSMGLLVNMNVDQFRVGDVATPVSDSITVVTMVQAPSWIQATNISLYANGIKIHEQTLGARPKGKLKPWIVEWELPRPAHDFFLVAIATGPGVTAPFWAIPRPYQPVSTHWDSRVIGSTNPIWVDADGDGKFNSARQYAQKIIGRRNHNGPQMLKDLAQYDAPTAAQLASLLTPAERQALESELADAPPHVQEGFKNFDEGEK